MLPVKLEPGKTYALWINSAKFAGFKDASGKVSPSGLIEGNLHQILNQLMGVAIAWTLAIVGTLVILKIVDVTIGLRVSEEHESQGLDLSQHGEEGYYWETSA